jgi:glucose-1-phosphate adenylyltransferase
VKIGERPEAMENRDDWGVAVVGHRGSVSPGTVIEPKAMISETVYTA